MQGRSPHKKKSKKNVHETSQSTMNKFVTSTSFSSSRTETTATNNTINSLQNCALNVSKKRKISSPAAQSKKAKLTTSETDADEENPAASSSMATLPQKLSPKKITSSESSNSFNKSSAKNKNISDSKHSKFKNTSKNDDAEYSKLENSLNKSQSMSLNNKSPTKSPKQNKSASIEKESSSSPAKKIKKNLKQQSDEFDLFEDEDQQMEVQHEETIEGWLNIGFVFVYGFEFYLFCIYYFSYLKNSGWKYIYLAILLG